MHRDYSSRLPERFTQNILGLHAEKGAEWLAALPGVIAAIAEKWSLDVENHFENLSFHYVAPCTLAGGKQAVLKIGYPEENSILYSEAKILKFLNGKGAVKLLEFDKKSCAVLLERLLPGENLIELCRRNDEAATAVAIEVMNKFWRRAPADGRFPSLQQWTNELEKAEDKAFGQKFIEKARSYFEELRGSSKRSFLLHGDMHHENILSAERVPFLAIDPKGIVGDIGYEISVFLNNPRSWVLTHANRGEILEKRLKMFTQSFKIEPRFACVKTQLRGLFRKTLIS